MAEIQKGFLKGWDWNSNEKNPSSIAMGLLTTVFLMGIMTGFLGTLLLQLIKLTPRGLLQPCNDYFFFSWESRKSDFEKNLVSLFFTFWCWRLWVEIRAQTTDLSVGAEQKVRGDRHGGEGSTARKNGQNLSNIITPHINLFSFLISFQYSYCFLPLTPCLSLMFLSCGMLFQEK